MPKRISNDDYPLIADFLDLSTPQVMAVVNLHRNSATEKAKVLNLDAALRYCEQAWSEGAGILDLGAEPTNPQIHSSVSAQEQLDLLLPLLENLRGFPIPISIDTSSAEVIKAVAAYGVSLINDVRSLHSKHALETLVDVQLPVCLMHMAYPNPHETALPAFDYGPDIVMYIKKFLQQQIQRCETAGVPQAAIIVDPGFGHGAFGKNLVQNLELLRRLCEFKDLGCPLLVGLSRKTFIGEALNLPISERLPASLAAATIAVMHGAKLIRTHDVKETVEAVKLAWLVQNGET